MSQTQINTQDNVWEDIQSQNQEKTVPWGRILPKRIKRKRLGVRGGHLKLSVAFDIDKKSLSIGKENADWCVDQKLVGKKYLPKISRNHCEIIKDCGNIRNSIFIEDLSLNGTFVNGALIGRNNKFILKTGDIISFGDRHNELFEFEDLYQESYGLPEQIFNQYYIGEKLGSGGQGTVCLVTDRRTCKNFALKIVKKSAVTDIWLEATIMRSLSHPNIINCIDFKHIDDSIYMFLDYMEGGDLLHLIRREKYLSEDKIKHLFRQLCDAVKYLHDRDYVHRDIKPENILLNSGGALPALKLADFGLSKIFNEDCTDLHTLCGTPGYLAPEIQNKVGRASYTNKVDIWSLGVVLYSMFCGRLPHNGIDYQLAIVRKVPGKAMHLVEKMLNRDSNHRPSIDAVLNHPWLNSNDDSISELNSHFRRHDLAEERTEKRRRLD